ncbi:hypothetical protein HBB16_18775 [Pseudonocardia sp. MCCB 268]|nr:hypothetical protein [Pseudonocardia cytotoxica]
MDLLHHPLVATLLLGAGALAGALTHCWLARLRRGAPVEPPWCEAGQRAVGPGSVRRPPATIGVQWHRCSPSCAGWVSPARPRTCCGGGCRTLTCPRCRRWSSALSGRARRGAARSRRGAAALAGRTPPST